MDNLFAARLQMAFSLGFHIIFAAIGIGMPLLMVIAEYRWLRTGNAVLKDLTKRWAKGTAIFFAVGAVSGTVLSFELGLLWPTFSRHAGSIIGFPFSLEGFAFFTEAIFLGIYLYAWDRVPRWCHWGAGVIVALSGAASALFVIMVNGWMNTPTGFTFDPATGVFSDIDPVAAMFNPAWLPQALHMLVAAYQATAFGAAGIHAVQLLRQPASALHREALKIAMGVGILAAIAQPIAGDYAATVVARTQPVKLAAMEGQFETTANAPLRIGGWPDVERRTTDYAIELPGMLSWLAYRDANATVQGLNDVPRDEWPPVAIVHVSFQIMVGLGVWMLAVGVWFAVAAWRLRAVPVGRRLLKTLVVTAPMGFIAIEAGWIVTEVGRQPWIIYGVMRTADAVTPMPGLITPLITFSVVFLLLGCVVTAVLVQQVKEDTVTVELMSAVCMLAALVAYVLLAGADFGAGIWDLLATGPRRQLQRDVLAHSVAPIWEANHVWLILVVVILLTGFPSAFSAIMTALHVPVTVVLLGIVARGSAFVFRAYSQGNASQQRWGSLFSIASVVTPIMLGVVLGTIASGELRWDGDTYISGFFVPWCKPFPWAVGGFALAIFAFLAATYVCVELIGRSQVDRAVQEDFRRRALIAAGAVGIGAAVTWMLARSGAPEIDRNLSGQWWKWPLQIATAMAAIGAIASLVLRRYVLARTCAVAQVTLIVGGFGAALFPFLVVPDFTIASSAAPPFTHRLLLAVIGLGALVLVPSLYVLFRVFKGRRAFAVIDEE